MLSDQLKFIYRGGQTKRFHTADTLTQQTVAEHSFGVAWMVMLISPSARKEVLLAALAHDLAEHLVGDVASPAKRRWPILKTTLEAAEGALLKGIGLDWTDGLTDAELRILKTADMFDGMMFCIRERRMGSLMVVDIYNNFYTYAKEFTGLPDGAFDLLQIIDNMWEKYNGSE